MEAGVVAAIIAVMSGMIERLRISSRPERVRKALDHSVETYARTKEHPELAAATKQLADLVHRQSTQLLTLHVSEVNRKRDPTSLVLGLVLAMGLGYLGYVIWRLGTWYWSALAIPLGIVALLFAWFGIESFFKGSRRDRDAGTTK